MFNLIFERSRSFIMAVSKSSFKSKIIAFVSCLALALIFTAIYAPPSLSLENISIPNLSDIRPFSAGSNYLSIEGYVISYCKVHYGKEISKREARMIIKRSLKASETGVKDTVSKIPATGYSEKLRDKLSEYRNKAKTIISKFDAKKVVLLPFINLTGKNNEAADLTNYFTAKYFASKGYKVISLPAEKTAGITLNSEPDLSATAKKYNAEFIIGGEINHFQRYKRFRLAGCLIDFAFTSVHGYADVSLSAKVFSASKKAFVYQNSAYGHKKHQFLAIFHSTNAVMSYAVNDAVKQLFEKF